MRRLALDEYGEGEPLVLIHGLGTNRGVWSDAAALLARGRRVIAIDLPGFGDSPPAGEGFDLEEVACLIADELDGRIGPSYDLLGHSLGGAVALKMARLRPEWVSRLILSAPAGFRPRERRLAEAVAAAAPILLRGRRLVGSPFVGNATARRALLWGAINDGAGLSPSRARAMLDSSRGAHRLRDATRAALTADLSKELAALELPLGLIWGSRDPLMPAATTDAIVRCRPGTPVEVVPGAGHVAQLEKPAHFAYAVDAALARAGHGFVTSAG